MRFRLANGNVVASTKQPLQNKDFDRIEISDDYEEWYDDNGTFDDYGGVPNNQITFNVKLYNPSTHTIRKSYCKTTSSRPILQFGPITDGNVGSCNCNKNAYGGNELVLSELSYGEVVDVDFTPNLAHFSPHYSHTVNPFDTNWYNSNLGIPEDQSLEPYENFWNDYYTIDYELHFIGTPHNKTVMTNRRHYGGGGRKMRIIEYEVTYYIH